MLFLVLSRVRGFVSPSEIGKKSFCGFKLKSKLIVGWGRGCVTPPLSESLSLFCFASRGKSLFNFCEGRGCHTLPLFDTLFSWDFCPESIFIFGCDVGRGCDTPSLSEVSFCGLALLFEGKTPS